MSGLATVPSKMNLSCPLKNVYFVLCSTLTPISPSPAIPFSSFLLSTCLPFSPFSSPSSCIPFLFYLLPPISTFPIVSCPYNTLTPLYPFHPSPFPIISFLFNPLSNYLLLQSPYPFISFSLYLHPPLSPSPTISLSHYSLSPLSPFPSISFPPLSPFPSIYFPLYLLPPLYFFLLYVLPPLFPSLTISFLHYSLPPPSPLPHIPRSLLLSELSILFSLSLTFPRYPLPFSLSLVRFV